jgi:hypothetical protein
MEVQSNGIMYYIEKEANETPEMLSSRAWFIVTKSPLNMEEYMKHYRLSIFWVNVVFLGCKYSNKIMNQLDIPKKQDIKPPPIDKWLPREKKPFYGKERSREFKFKTDLRYQPSGSLNF